MRLLTCIQVAFCAALLFSLILRFLPVRHAPDTHVVYLRPAVFYTGVALYVPGCLLLALGIYRLVWGLIAGGAVLCLGGLFCMLRQIRQRMIRTGEDTFTYAFFCGKRRAYRFSDARHLARHGRGVCVIMHDRRRILIEHSAYRNKDFVRELIRQVRRIRHLHWEAIPDRENKP